MNRSILVSIWRERSALTMGPWGGVDVLRRAQYFPKIVLRVAQTDPDRRAGRSARGENSATDIEPPTLTEEVKDQAVAVREASETSGLDHGPISVHEKMCDVSGHR